MAEEYSKNVLREGGKKKHFQNFFLTTFLTKIYQFVHKIYQFVHKILF